MAKGNLFLGFGRGKVGDVVFSRQNGEQVTRARNRSPRNPQTPLQLLQRVVLKTSSSAFSLMQDICNHSFQGSEGVTQNQAAFNIANVALFRQQLADIINGGDASAIISSTEANFMGKGATAAGINAYQISDGKLPDIPLGWVTDADETTAAYPCITTSLGALATLTYNDFINAFSLQRGDQLTAIALTCDDTEDGSDGTFNGFHYGRFILEPSNGDLSEKMQDSTKWNAKNENILISAAGSPVKISLFPASVAEMMPNAHARSVAAAAIIVSRLVGGTWSRSKTFMNLRPCTAGVTSNLAWDTAVNLLGDAVLSYMSEESSLLYLNQAET